MTFDLRRDWSRWLGLLARLVLGLMLVIPGLLKIGDLNAAGQSARAYQILPFDVGTIVGQALPFVEIIVGLLLIAGLLTRASGAVGALLMLVYIVAIASVWARHIAIDCGCFGQGGPVKEFKPWTYFWDIVRDAALMACGVWLTVRPITKLALDNKVFPPIPED